VLTYYAITNAAALTLLAGCLLLIGALPPAAVVTGTAVLVVGVAARLVTLRVTGQPPSRE
jgi:hypothetical protein